MNNPTDTAERGSMPGHARGLSAGRGRVRPLVPTLSPTGDVSAVLGNRLIVKPSGIAGPIWGCPRTRVGHTPAALTLIQSGESPLPPDSGAQRPSLAFAPRTLSPARGHPQPARILARSRIPFPGPGLFIREV